MKFLFAGFWHSILEQDGQTIRRRLGVSAHRGALQHSQGARPALPSYFNKYISRPYALVAGEACSLALVVLTKHRPGSHERHCV